MLRNDKTKELVSNGPRRNGQFNWHDENCMVEHYGIENVPQPHRVIWCATHGQWAHETPVVVEYRFEDGTKVTRRTER